MPTAYLSLGSNLGDRLAYLREAIEKIGASEEISLENVSPVYETEPVGPSSQGWFLNLVIEVRTSLDPASLLDTLSAVEDRMGRTRESKWGPRNIDIDILLYDDRIVSSGRPTIPHPRMHKRRFVLVPLEQIASRLLHPVLKKSTRELLESCEDKSVVKLYSGKI